MVVCALWERVARVRFSASRLSNAKEGRVGKLSRYARSAVGMTLPASGIEDRSDIPPVGGIARGGPASVEVFYMETGVAIYS